MNKLEEARVKIDEIDSGMRDLFVKRMQIVIDVARYKKENGLPILNEERELEVIKKNLGALKEEQLKPYYEEFLIECMRISKEYQKELIK
ncbi:MAG: chorismate mutase [Anaeroplasmataceae bacterium]|nr:chorismate mutase [Anaeroplasmataceae bacterium]MDE5867566.1 chorismate mutase [Anaeroplasmataceae bacterium]